MFCYFQNFVKKWFNHAIFFLLKIYVLGLNELSLTEPVLKYRVWVAHKRTLVFLTSATSV